MEVACCDPTGFIDEGTPVGSTTKLGDIQVYLSEPKDTPTNAIVIATDIFGIDLVNTKLIADAFANRGFLVVVPDLFNGKPLAVESMATWEKPSKSILDFFSIGAMVVGTFAPFLLKHPYSKTLLIIEQTIKNLKEKYSSVKKVGVQGYCYGGKLGVWLANSDLADAVAVAHPSSLDEKDIMKIKAPSLFIFAEKDFALGESLRKKIEDTLKKNLGDNFQSFIYEGTKHGFAVRGDASNPTVKAARESAFENAVNFFSKCFRNT